MTAPPQVVEELEIDTHDYEQGRVLQPIGEQPDGAVVTSEQVHEKAPRRGPILVRRLDSFGAG